MRQEGVLVVGAQAYEVGRRAFFTGLLGRRIFQSECFAHLEEWAQANIERALA